MAMPHPGFFMIPFGCVVCQRQTRKGFSLDIYRDVAQIRNLHDAFAQSCQHGVGNDLADTIVSIKDDTDAKADQDHCSVIFYDDFVLDHPYGQQYLTWRVNDTLTAPQQVNTSAADFYPKIVMDSDWHYFVLTTSMRPYKSRLRLKTTRRTR
jgi:hypothetical protein